MLGWSSDFSLGSRQKESLDTAFVKYRGRKMATTLGIQQTEFNIGDLSYSSWRMEKVNWEQRSNIEVVADGRSYLPNAGGTQDENRAMEPKRSDREA